MNDVYTNGAVPERPDDDGHEPVQMSQQADQASMGQVPQQSAQSPISQASHQHLNAPVQQNVPTPTQQQPTSALPHTTARMGQAYNTAYRPAAAASARTRTTSTQQVRHGYNPSNSSVRTSPKKGVPSWISGGLAGLLGALLMFGVLKFAGLLNPPAQADTSNTSGSAAQSQPLSIQAQAEDATISEVVAAKALPSVVSIYVTANVGDGIGSGVILDKEGNIITNYHVIEGAQSIQVTLGKESYDASIIGTDASSDLAVIRADFGDAEITPIERGDSDALVVGDWVMTIGSPYGLDQSVSTGIVSSLYRSTMLASYANERLIYTNLIQTDAAINPGNSGGALVNERGQLVGINSIVSSSSGANAAVNFAIPGNYAYEVAETILAGKVVEHAQLGANVATVTTANAARYSLGATRGAYVSSVNEGSSAEAAGIQEGDIIIKLGDDEIASADALILGVRSHKIGDTVSVVVVRGTDELTLEATLGSDGGNAGNNAPQSSYGGLLGEGDSPDLDSEGYGYGYGYEGLNGDLEELLRRLGYGGSGS